MIWLSLLLSVYLTVPSVSAADDILVRESPLVGLVQARFPDLSATERSVVAGFADQQSQPTTPPTSDPTIRGEIISWILCHGAAAECLPKRTLQLSHVDIEGAIDLIDSTALCPLVLNSCTLLGGLQA